MAAALGCNSSWGTEVFSKQPASAGVWALVSEAFASDWTGYGFLLTSLQKGKKGSKTKTNDIIRHATPNIMVINRCVGVR